MDFLIFLMIFWTFRYALTWMMSWHVHLCVVVCQCMRLPCGAHMVHVGARH